MRKEKLYYNNVFILYIYNKLYGIITGLHNNRTTWGSDFNTCPTGKPLNNLLYLSLSLSVMAV